MSIKKEKRDEEDELINPPEEISAHVIKIEEDEEDPNTSHLTRIIALIDSEDLFLTFLATLPESAVYHAFFST